MSSPHSAARPAARAHAPDRVALAETAGVLRQLAEHDSGSDTRRGAVSMTLAALVDAIGRDYAAAPREITRRAMEVVAAVDSATGRRR